MKQAIALSDQLIEELQSVDVLLLSVPMYNFSVPSALKAWIDQIVRIGRSFAFIDAPVAGTLPQADTAQLIYFVGGDVETFTKAQPILQTMGSSIHHAGIVGSGMTIKLAVNTLFGIQISALGELMGLMKGCGLDEAKAIEILTSTPVCSPAAKGAAAGMLARNFSSLFPIELNVSSRFDSSSAARIATSSFP